MIHELASAGVKQDLLVARSYAGVPMVSAAERRVPLNACSDGDDGRASASSPRGAVELRSEDRSLAFELKPVGARLFIQRTNRASAGSLAVQCMLLKGHEQFRRWCESEPARFDHPVLFNRLRRYGDEVLARRD